MSDNGAGRRIPTSGREMSRQPRIWWRGGRPQLAPQPRHRPSPESSEETAAVAYVVAAVARWPRGGGASLVQQEGVGEAAVGAEVEGSGFRWHRDEALPEAGPEHGGDVALEPLRVRGARPDQVELQGRGAEQDERCVHDGEDAEGDGDGHGERQRQDGLARGPRLAVGHRRRAQDEGQEKGRLEKAGHERVADEEEEKLVVAGPDAVGDPRAVVVHLQNAPAADDAVVGAGRAEAVALAAKGDAEPVRHL